MTPAPDTPAPDRTKRLAPSGLTRDELAFFAHELRGGLTVIVGYADLLGHDLTAAERHAALSGIERAVARIDGLCADALAGRAPHRPPVQQERARIALLAEQIGAEQASASGRRVDVTIAENVGETAVSGSAHALARALGNLIGNALKYSPADSAVEVRVAREIDAEGELIAVVEVADRGPGIPERDRERVFEPFERLGRDGAKPGSGLGLAIVRDVVEAHGGRVAIRDREGGGAIVRVELPAAEAEGTE